MAEQKQNDPFEDLLKFIHRERGFDFTGYKRSSLRRRIEKRMGEVEIDTFQRYRNYLEAHPGEFDLLFNTILINVTSFYRDPEAWQHLQNNIIPMLESRHDDGPMRVWSAACSSGQEPASIGMAFAEVFGLEHLQHKVKIYATDVDEEALEQARRGYYSAQELESVPEAMREKYFIQEGDRYQVHPQIRRLIIYGVHNLVADPPISHLNLLVCRNTVMFFNKELQREIAQRFHFALEPEAVLFLGRAETLISQDHLFTPLNLKHRFYTPVKSDEVAGQLRAMAEVGVGGLPDRVLRRVEFYELHMDHHPLAEIIVARDGQLVVANQAARRKFEIDHDAIGEAFSSLDVSFRPIDLRSMIEEAKETGVKQVAEEVRHETGHNGEEYLNISVVPLKEKDGAIPALAISFREVTDHVELRHKYAEANEELEKAYEQLQSTNEEIETTNEELHSTIEELETTNEELQSTNEEMETMNEELESTNEELRATNLELQRRTSALNRANAFLNSVLSSLQIALIVVDRDMQITAWNEQAYELWGISSEEAVERPLTELDIGLPVEQLEEPVSHFLEDGRVRQEELELQAINRKGQAIDCNITIAPLIDAGDSLTGALLLVEAKRVEE